MPSWSSRSSAIAAWRTAVSSRRRSLSTGARCGAWRGRGGGAAPRHRQDQALRDRADVRGGRRRPDGRARAPVLRVRERRERAALRALPAQRWRLRGDRAGHRRRVLGERPEPRPGARAARGGRESLSSRRARPASPVRRRIGAHLPLGGGMLKAVERAVEIGANALQVFSDNPTAWRRRASPPAELTAFRERLREADVTPLAIHASYLINLAGPEDAFYEPSIELLAHELEAGRLYGARYVNVHVGSHRGAGVHAGLERLGSGLARVLERAPDGDGPLLVLENSAGGGG